MKKQLQSLFVVLLIALSAMAQGQVITGTVTSAEDRLPIPGVSVKIKGAKTGTQTDANGKYAITVSGNADVLEFSYLGYKTESRATSSLGVVNVGMVTDENALNEVVVTGYTSVSRAKSASASTTVSGDKIASVPNGSFDQILQGRVPGLTAVAGSGQPGASARVIIRGQSSITGNNNPLYVMDGVPIEATVFQSLNANDFESVTVLKDASATALYGSRGSAGVVVITSRKGSAGKTVISYNGQGGVSTRTRSKFDMLSAPQLLTLQEAARLGAGWTLSPLNTANVTATNTAAIKAGRLDSLKNSQTDWGDIFFRDGSFQSHQVAASGGNDKTRFYSSLSYYNQEGITERSSLKRYNYRLNLDHKDGRLTLGMQSAVGFSRSNFIESEASVTLANPFAAAYLALPFEKPYDATGRIITTGSAGQYNFPIYDSRIGSNALDRYSSTSNLQNQFKGTISLNAAYEIAKGLKVKSTLGIDYRENNTERSIYPGTYPGGLTNIPGQQGSYGLGNVRNFQLVSTSGFNYFNVFNNKHEVEASALYERIDNRLNTYSFTGYGINPKLLNTGAGITPGTNTNGLIPVVAGAKTRAAFVSGIFIGRYTYDGKYTVQASFRRDGSSKLPEDNRFHNFYSVGLNWNAKRESFLENVSFIDALRVRGSYGVAANGNGSASTTTSSDFGYIPTYSSISYAGVAGIAPTSPGNELLDWEYSKSFNVGFDAEIIKGMITLQLDLYNKETDQVLIDQQLSRTSGFTSLTVNAGKVRNRGIETAADFKIVRSRDWDFSLNANFAYNKNEVTDLGQVEKFEQGTSIIRVGLPLGSHYAVKNAGVDPATGTQMYYNADGTKTNVYNAATQSVADFGTFNAPFTGGFGSALRFKAFDFSTFFSFANNYSRYSNESYFLTNVGNIGAYNQTTSLLNYWQTPGQVTDVPKLGTLRQFNSQDIYDASFIRLRNVIIGYTLPQNLVKSIKFISGVRLYVQGQNLYTWTKWPGFDPEDNNNIAQFEYPATRQFTFGLDVKF
jgi:TonB-linked SusC/RagA family outer membrane protein